MSTVEATPIFDELFGAVTPETRAVVLDCFDLSADAPAPVDVELPGPVEGFDALAQAAATGLAGLDWK